MPCVQQHANVLLLEVALTGTDSSHGEVRAFARTNPYEMSYADGDMRQVCGLRKGHQPEVTVLLHSSAVEPRQSTRVCAAIVGRLSYVLRFQAVTVVILVARSSRFDCRHYSGLRQQAT